MYELLSQVQATLDISLHCILSQSDLLELQWQHKNQPVQFQLPILFVERQRFYF
jgi:hypothetical protein